MAGLDNHTNANHTNANHINANHTLYKTLPYLYATVVLGLQAFRYYRRSPPNDRCKYSAQHLTLGPKRCGDFVFELLPTDKDGSLLPSDQKAFVDHCEDCFRVKGTPREYFEAHLNNDKMHTVLVARCFRDGVLHSGSIVSSVRIFHRRVWGPQGKHILSVAGIGEVGLLFKYALW